MVQESDCESGPEIVEVSPYDVIELSDDDDVDDGWDEFACDDVVMNTLAKENMSQQKDSTKTRDQQETNVLEDDLEKINNQNAQPNESNVIKRKTTKKKKDISKPKQSKRQQTKKKAPINKKITADKTNQTTEQSPRRSARLGSRQIQKPLSPESETEPQTPTQQSKPPPSSPTSPSNSSRIPSKVLIDQLVSEEIESRGTVSPTSERRIRKKLYNREYKRLNQDRLKQYQQKPESRAKAKVRNARGKQSLIAKYGLDWFREKQRVWNQESRARKSEQQREARRKKARAHDASVRARMKELAQKGDREAIVFFEHKRKLNQDWHKRMYEGEDEHKRQQRLDKIRQRYQRMKKDNPDKYREKIRRNTLRNQQRKARMQQEEEESESEEENV